MEIGQVNGAANAVAVPDVLGDIKIVRFRAAFRADGVAPGALAADNAQNNAIIDQYNRGHLTAADAVAAYNQG